MRGKEEKKSIKRGLLFVTSVNEKAQVSSGGHFSASSSSMYQHSVRTWLGATDTNLLGTSFHTLTSF